MSLNAATIAVLIAKGLTAEDLLEVARATEVKADRTNAERQARHRRKRNAVTVTDAPLNEDTSKPCPSGTKVPSGHRSADADFPRPEWADPQVWKDFLTNRRRKRLPNTSSAHKAFLDDVRRLADDEWPPGRLLEYAAAKGWGAIYDPRKPMENRNGQHREPAESPLARIRREAQEAECKTPQAGVRNGAALPPVESGGNLFPSGQAGAADRGSDRPARSPA